MTLSTKSTKMITKFYHIDYLDFTFFMITNIKSPLIGTSDITLKSCFQGLKDKLLK